MTEETNDPADALGSMCDDIQSHVPCQSIILAGSRATGEATATGDFDIIVVMRTVLVPFYLGILRRMSARWQRRLGVRVSIKPLAAHRARRSGGSLFLYKVRRDARTIRGRDHRDIIRPVSPGDIGARHYFSYLCSAMAGLAGAPAFPGTNSESDGDSGRQVLLAAAKAILVCGETLVLRHGHSAAGRPDLQTAFRSMGAEPGAGGMTAEELGLATAIRRGDRTPPVSAFTYWLRSKDITCRALVDLLREHAGIRQAEDPAVAVEYLQRRGRGGLAGVLANAQYCLLRFLAAPESGFRRELRWRSLLGSTRVDVRIGVALLLLLLAVGEDGSADRHLVETCRRVLKGYTSPLEQQPQTVAALWGSLRDAALVHCEFAFPVMGI